MDQEFDLILNGPTTGRQYRKDLWRYRELFYFLAWRDILVRYKQTAIGVAWSVLRPVLTMVVFTVIFGRLAKFPAGGRPYSLFVFAALLPWQLFANAFSHSSNSVIANASMITKVFFPRLIAPISSVIASLLDFAISLGVLALLMLWYRFLPDWRIIFLPVFFLIALVAAMGLGFLLSAINVKYRDFHHALPFALQLLLYISPVGFGTSVVSTKWRLLYSINPMVGVIDGFRWSLLGGSEKLFIPGLVASTFLSVVIFAAGLHYFRKAEPTFPDWI